jgi:uroporphyrinogen III methyltransferase / synthase
MMAFQFNLPLAGKRIVVTRAPEQADDFISSLESFGAEVVLLPTIAFAEVEDSTALDQAASELATFDWVIFTSRNALKFLASRLKALKIPLKRTNHPMPTPKIAVIGAATGEEAWSAGFIPDYEAAESRGEALAQELLEKVRGKRVLLPRSNKADTTLPQRLRDAGAEVMEVIAYRTIAPPLEEKTLEDVREGDVDVITFLSPSAYKNLAGEIGVENLRRHSGKIVIASIGPTTSSAIRQDGLEVAIEASSASAVGVSEAIANYFRERARLGMAS